MLVLAQTTFPHDRFLHPNFSQLFVTKGMPALDMAVGNCGEIAEAHRPGYLRWGPLMSAMGFEPMRTCVQWILSPPPWPLGQTDCCLQVASAVSSGRSVKFWVYPRRNSFITWLYCLTLQCLLLLHLVIWFHSPLQTLLLQSFLLSGLFLVEISV